MYIEEFAKRELNDEEMHQLLLELSEQLKDRDLFPEATAEARKFLQQVKVVSKNF